MSDFNQTMQGQTLAAPNIFQDNPLSGSTVTRCQADRRG